jgi:hypothetical protein
MSTAADPTNPALGKQTGTESSLSSWAGPYVTNMLGMGQALAQTPFQAYQGPLTAGYTAPQQQAFSGIAGLTVPGAIGEATTTAGQVAGAAGGMEFTPGTFTNQYQTPADIYKATDITTGAFTPQAAQQYMNPYLQSALDPQIAEARRQADISRLQDAARLSRAGAFGGSRQAIMESEAQRNLLRNLSDITGRGYASAYEQAQQAFTQDQARALQAQQATEALRQAQGQQALSAAQQGAQFGQAARSAEEASRQFGAGFGLDALRQQLAGAQAQGTLGQQGLRSALDIYGEQARLGGQERAIEQSAIDAARQQFEEEKLFPYKQVQFMQSLLQDLPLQTQQYSYQQPSGIQQLLGGSGELMSFIADLFKTTPAASSQGTGGFNPTPGDQVVAEGVGANIPDAGSPDDALDAIDYAANLPT